MRSNPLPELGLPGLGRASNAAVRDQRARFVVWTPGTLNAMRTQDFVPHHAILEVPGSPQPERPARPGEPSPVPDPQPAPVPDPGRPGVPEPSPPEQPEPGAPDAPQRDPGGPETPESPERPEPVIPPGG